MEDLFGQFHSKKYIYLLNYEKTRPVLLKSNIYFGIRI